MDDKKKTKEEIREIMKVVPHNLDAEQAVLGAILSDNEVAIEIVPNLQKEDFYLEAHQEIFEQLTELNKRNVPMDVVSLTEILTKKGKLKKVGGMSMLTQLIDAIPTTANYEYYVGIVKNNSLLRRIIRNCNSIIYHAHSEEDAENVLAVAENLIYNIAQEKDTSELEHIAGITVDVLKELSERYNSPDKEDLGTLRVGLSNLDQITGGFRPGQLIILAARPGCGKTSFCMNIVANIVKSGPEKVLAIFNLEMSKGELVQRLISNIARIDSRTLQRGEQDKNQMDAVWTSTKVLNDSEVYIDDSASITAEQIMSKCRRLKSQKGRIDLVVVDYLQLITSSHPLLSKQQQVADMSRLMKIMAKELKCPVIVLSQMSRDIEKRDDKTPMLADLRESGAIEQDADMVFFLMDGDFDLSNSDATPITLKIAKHRNGTIGDIDFKWEKAMTNFIPVFNAVHRPKDSVDKQGKKMEQVNAPNGEEQTYQYDYVPLNEELVAPPIEDFAPVVENNDDVTPNVDDIFGNLKSKEMKTKPNAGDIEE
ncbi:MAG: replicative DNA helicase [Christensenellales bacterium]